MYFYVAVCLTDLQTGPLDVSQSDFQAPGCSLGTSLWFFHLRMTRDNGFNGNYKQIVFQIFNIRFDATSYLRDGIKHHIKSEIQ